MSKKADCWIRHRGGKCPVEAGVKVDYRMRDGEIDCFGRDAGRLQWNHEPDDGDIMAYRLHKPAEQVDACSKPELQINLPDGYGEIYRAQAVERGPIQWRDRITEIDATTQALTTERAELVQKLASEGFALIGRINELLTDAAQKHEDMGDFRNWKVGDLVQVIDPESSGLLAGKAYPISELEEEIEEEDEIHGLPCLLADGDTWLYAKNMRWHSRPSA